MGLLSKSGMIKLNIIVPGEVFWHIRADIINSNNTILTVRVGYDELPMLQKLMVGINIVAH